MRVAGGNWNRNNDKANLNENNADNPNNNARVRLAVMAMCFVLPLTILPAFVLLLRVVLALETAWFHWTLWPRVEVSF